MDESPSDLFVKFWVSLWNLVLYYISTFIQEIKYKAEDIYLFLWIQIHLRPWGSFFNLAVGYIGWYLLVWGVRLLYQEKEMAQRREWETKKI